MAKPNNLKPIYWLLFAAGGMIAALVLPALMVILSWLLPFGVIGSADTFYQTVSPLFQNGLFYFFRSIFCNGNLGLHSGCNGHSLGSA